MRTIVYVDGFNLYYGLFKNKLRTRQLTAYKWLDLECLSRRLLPRDRLERVRYFTADVSAMPNDPDQPVRQQTYLRALGTIQCLEIHKGKFIPTTKRGVPVDQKRHGPGLIEIRLFEEKGSDVNIAAHLLRDAFRGDCEKAVVISNDSDLAEPLRIARDDLGVVVMVVSPYAWVTNDLKVASSSSGILEPRLARQCQFPPVVVDSRGNHILKPRSW